MDGMLRIKNKKDAHRKECNSIINDITKLNPTPNKNQT